MIINKQLKKLSFNYLKKSFVLVLVLLVNVCTFVTTNNKLFDILKI